MSSKEEVVMKLSATFSSTSNMNFFLIHKQIGASIWKPIYKSEIQAAKSGAYHFNMINILTSDLAGDDIEQPVRIDFFNSAKSGKHKHCGQVTLTLGQLKEGTREYPLTDKKQKALGANYKMNFSQLEIK